MRSSCAVSALGLSALGVFTLVAPVAQASAFETYGGSYRAISMPPIGPGSFDVVGDALPDGRLVAVTGNEFFVESGVKTGVFSLAGSIDPGAIGGATDPSFLRVSPDGSRIALGAGFGKPVVVFDAADLSVSAPPLLDASSADIFNVNHFDAAWQDNANLAITFGDFGSPSSVSLLDTSSDPLAPINNVVISNIGGGSAGVAFDGAGRLFTGNGFDTEPGGSETGSIRAFDPAEWMTGAVDFEVGGIEIAEILSSASLSFDLDGNLFVGGGDFGGGDLGTLAVVNTDAIDLALGGMGVIDILDPTQVRRLDPRGDGFGFFGSVFNDVTSELYIRDGATWYATVPAPAPLAALAVFGISRRRCRSGA